MPRRFLICLAFATFCFFDTWVEYAEGSVAYFARWDPITAVVIPILGLEIIIALTMLGLWELCRARKLDRGAPFHFLFLLVCLVPLGIVAVALLRVVPFHLTVWIRSRFFWPAAMTVAIVPLCAVYLRPRTASLLIRNILLFSWPVLILVLVQAARGTLLKYPRTAYGDRPLAAPFDTGPAPIRVIWIVFDELSQTIAFGNRPADLDLPNFDRLKGGSLWATSAESPAAYTDISMPSLILGQQLLDVRPRGPDDLTLVTQSGSQPLEWRSARNVFDTARDLRVNTALVGWSHPYGRLLNHSLTKCYWTAGWLLAGVEERFKPQSLLEAMGDRVRLQFSALPLAGHLPGAFPGIYHRQEKLERFLWLRGHALEIVSDPTIGLALIHLPVPHPPAIFNRKEDVLTTRGHIGYIDSVALADRTLGLLRASMEQAGIWDRTAVIVSADHGWRTYIWRGGAEWTPDEELASHQDTSGVPFLVKLPRQTSGVVYNQRFNTVITRQIITEVLKGQLTDPNQLAEFIERKTAARAAAR